MSTAAPSTLYAELAALAGAEQVFQGAHPFLEVSPRSEQELAGVLQLCHQREWLVAAAGAMEAAELASAVPAPDVLLRTRHLDQVQHYDPGDLTVGVGAGMPVEKVLAMLAEHNQFLPLEPQDAGSTVGGMLARAAHGPLAHGFGTLRDFCIGIRFATVDGKVVKGGGRVVKNVAGYDLMKLMIGSHGTLGVIVSANFRVFPAPRQTRTFVAQFAGLAEALAFRDRLAGSPLTPICVDILSPLACECFRPGVPGAWQIWVRAAGSEAVLARYARELGAAVAHIMEGESERAAWAGVAGFAGMMRKRSSNAMLMQLSLPPSGVQTALEAAQRCGLDQNLLFAASGRAALGLLNIAFLPIGQPNAMQYAQAASALRAALPRDASAVVTHGPQDCHGHFSLWGTTPNDLEMMRAVKYALDPAGILCGGGFLL